MRQKYQNLRQLQTAIFQARNKLLTNFQRLESTTRHGHMESVQKSNMGMTKKVRQKYQNLRQLQTAISQARNKLLTNFQRLESTTRHGHMGCV